MSNFTTLESTPVSPPPAPADQEVKAEPQIGALASSEAQPATASPSAGSGKDASPSASHRCRRCGENVKSVQFHQRTVHQKRCIVVFQDGTKETLTRPADGERFICSKCSYGHRDPQYLQIHARQRCNGQSPEGGNKLETPRRKRRKTAKAFEEVDSLDDLSTGDAQVTAKEETSSTGSASVSASRAPANGHGRPRFELPSIETTDRSRSASASPSLSELLVATQRIPHLPSTTQPRLDVDVPMNGASPKASTPLTRATTSRSASPNRGASSLPPTVHPSIAMAGPSNHTSPAISPSTSRASSHGLRVRTGDHLDADHRVAQQPTPSSSIPPSPLLPQNPEDITGRFALVPAFPLPSTSAASSLAAPSQSIPHPYPPPHPLARRPDEVCPFSPAAFSSSSSSSGSSTRIDQRPAAPPVDVFLRSLSSTLAPPPHIARAFRELGYDTDELLDALARANPAEGDWALLEKEVLIEKRFHAWWILVKNGLHARREALQRVHERVEWAR